MPKPKSKDDAKGVKTKAVEASDKKKAAKDSKKRETKSNEKTKKPSVVMVKDGCSTKEVGKVIKPEDNPTVVMVTDLDKEKLRQLWTKTKKRPPLPPPLQKAESMARRPLPPPPLPPRCHRQAPPKQTKPSNEVKYENMTCQPYENVSSLDQTDLELPSDNESVSQPWELHPEEVPDQYKGRRRQLLTRSDSTPQMTSPSRSPSFPRSSSTTSFPKSPVSSTSGTIRSVSSTSSRSSLFEMYTDEGLFWGTIRIKRAPRPLKALKEEEHSPYSPNKPSLALYFFQKGNRKGWEDDLASVKRTFEVNLDCHLRVFADLTYDQTMLKLAELAVSKKNIFYL